MNSYETRLHALEAEAAANRRAGVGFSLASAQHSDHARQIRALNSPTQNYPKGS